MRPFMEFPYSEARPADEAAAALAQVSASLAEVGESWIGGLTEYEAAVNLLQDHHQPEQTEHLVEIEAIDAPTAAFAVVGHHLAAGQHAGHVRWLTTQRVERGVVVGLYPVGHRAAEIHHRIAERAHLPIEHTDDVERVRGVEHHVVESVIVVDHADGGLAGGLLLCKPCH